MTEHHTHDWHSASGARLDERVSRGAPRDTVSPVSIAVNKLKEIMVLKGFQRAGGERPHATGHHR